MGRIVILTTILRYRMFRRLFILWQSLRLLPIPRSNICCIEVKLML